MDLQWLIPAIIIGAVLGDTVNYWIGNYLGIHVFLERFPTLVKKEYIERTYGFYEKYGGQPFLSPGSFRLCGHLPRSSLVSLDDYRRFFSTMLQEESSGHLS